MFRTWFWKEFGRPSIIYRKCSVYACYVGSFSILYLEQCSGRWGRKLIVKAKSVLKTPLCFLSVVTRLFCLLSDWFGYEGGCDLIDRDTHWSFYTMLLCMIMLLKYCRYHCHSLMFQIFFFSHNRGVLLMKGNI